MCYSTIINFILLEEIVPKNSYIILFESSTQYCRVSWMKILFCEDLENCQLYIEQIYHAIRRGKFGPKTGIFRKKSSV